MCVAGLYFVFLMLEDVIVGYYSTDAASQDKEMNLKTLYEIFQKNSTKSNDGDIIRQNNEKQKSYSIFNVSKTLGKQRKNWKVDRVTRKQYEIINMLWRKTKIFFNEDSISTAYPTTYQDNKSKAKVKSKSKVKRFQANNPIKFTITSSTSSKTTTPSNIEFYYLEENEISERSLNSNNTTITPNPPFFVFHLKSPYAIPQPARWNFRSNYSQLDNEQAWMSKIRQNKPQKVTQQAKIEDNSYQKRVRNKIQDKSTKQIFSDYKNLFSIATLSVTFKHENIPTINQTKSITVYDKIKFFEMYDQYTPVPNFKKENILKLDYYDDETYVSKDQKILLEHVDQSSHDHKQAKHAKKHIIEQIHQLNKTHYQNIDMGKPKSKAFILMNTTFKKQTKEKLRNISIGIETYSSDNKMAISYTNASWSEYPFAAVYIYELSQVHCDAAGISAHWLVAAGSCLSRVNKSPSGEGRSAFVAYCGVTWWQPERIAYVKYSVVHPLYHHRDKTRKHLYNIGVIQVVTSMVSACSGWRPVSLMSHQFTVDPKGTLVLAVGWGLDRFDTRYSAEDLTKIPLMLYKGLVYFDSCPGNVAYSKAKRLDKGGGVRNVYCLSLPPYSKEETDPVHGGLLLIGGKLIALYLQEERRPWGEQSAQYTGIWGLIPWVMDVAREPEDVDNFNFDI